MRTDRSKSYSIHVFFYSRYIALHKNSWSGILFSSLIRSIPGPHAFFHCVAVQLFPAGFNKLSNISIKMCIFFFIMFQ